MLSSTLKRSAATLSIVVAGLLAAAGPASAQFWEGKSLTSQAPKASVVIDLNDPFFAVVSGAEMTAAVKAPASFTSVSNNLRGEAIDIIP